MYADTGDATMAGTLTQGTSDSRLKNNKMAIKNSLEKVNSLTGYEFDWNDVGLENDPNRMKHIHNVGVIAQEIYAVMPEVVHERVDGFLAVDYERMCALLIQAIKEQQEQINDLKSDVIKLCEESHVHGPKGSAAVDPKTEKILYEEE